MKAVERYGGAPLLILAAAGAILVIAGILGWGAGNSVGAEPWIPTYAGVVPGLFTVVWTLVLIRRQRQLTSGPFRLRSPSVLIGLGLLSFLVVAVLLSAFAVGDPERYRVRFADDEVEVWDDPSLEPGPFVVILALICCPGPVSWFLYGISHFYVDAFDPVSTEVEGRDPMGEIIRTI
jgi:hypothetical protein